MSAQPGWYQDPEGPAGQARYWDGNRWAPAPGAPTPGSEPDGPRRPAWLVPAVVVLVSAVLVGLGVWQLGPLLFSDGDPAPAPTATSSEGTSPQATTPVQEPTQVGELDCVAASSSNFDSGPELRVAGIVVPFGVHDEWGFRFDSSQWTWLHDLHAWGTVDIEPRGEQWAAGIVVGRLEAGSGFGEPRQAAEAMVECLLSHGPFNTGEQMEISESGAVTVDGMPGWSMTMAYPEEGEYGATTIRVLALDSGQEGNLAGVIGFHPQGHPGTEAAVEELLGGIVAQ